MNNIYLQKINYYDKNLNKYKLNKYINLYLNNINGGNGNLFKKVSNFIKTNKTITTIKNNITHLYDKHTYCFYKECIKDMITHYFNELNKINKLSEYNGIIIQGKSYSTFINIKYYIFIFNKLEYNNLSSILNIFNDLPFDIVESYKTRLFKSNNLFFNNNNKIQIKIDEIYDDKLEQFFDKKVINNTLTINDIVNIKNHSSVFSNDKNNIIKTKLYDHYYKTNSNNYEIGFTLSDDDILFLEKNFKNNIINEYKKSNYTDYNGIIIKEYDSNNNYKYLIIFDHKNNIENIVNNYKFSYDKFKLYFIQSNNKLIKNKNNQPSIKIDKKNINELTDNIIIEYFSIIEDHNIYNFNNNIKYDNGYKFNNEYINNFNKYYYIGY
jgi:hypothetical protein